MPVCLLTVVSFRSLAIARSLLRFGSPCGAMPLGLFYSAVKAFQCGGGADRGDLLVPFVAPLGLAVGAILIDGRSSFSWLCSPC